MDRTMVLLGAGASVEAGVPASYDMTRRVMEQFATNSYPSKYSLLIRYVVGGLLFQHGIRGEDPFGGVDVEELFSAVILLAERHELEAAPFIGSWHSAVEDIDRSAPNLRQFDRILELIYDTVAKQVWNATVSTPGSSKYASLDNRLAAIIHDAIEAYAKGRDIRIRESESLAYSIGDLILAHRDIWVKEFIYQKLPSRADLALEFARAVEETSRPGKGEIFRTVADLMVRMLADIVWIDSPSKVEYLSPLLKLADGQGRVVISTLNYDNSIELLSRNKGCMCSTGIDNWSQRGSFDVHSDGIVLLKLHGSIDWASKLGQQSPERPMPYTLIEQVSDRSKIGVDHQPTVVFGQRNKLKATGPFLDLLHSFRSELARVKRLLIVGYSFRDDHINEYISQWLNASPEHRVTVVDPNFRGTPAEYAKKLAETAREQLTVVEKDAAAGLNEVFL